MVKFWWAGCVNRDQQIIEVSIIIVGGNTFIFSYRIFCYMLATSYLHCIVFYRLAFILFRK
jgi:hypothetical protein